MNIPSKIRIKSKVSYDIVYQDVISNDVRCLGMCDPNTKIIYLKTGLSETELAKTFIHELFHCFEVENKIKIPHKSIYKLEGAILKFLKLNGLL